MGHLVIPIDKLVAPPNTRAKLSDWQVAESAPPRTFGGNFKPEVKDSEELRRVLALPRRTLPDTAKSEAFIIYMTDKYKRHNTNCICATKRRKCITKLRRAQAWALYEMSHTKGLLGSIGVGHGKTLLGLLAPMALGLKPGQIAVLLVPPSNVGEIIDEYELASQHFNLTSITVHSSGNYTRRVPGTPALHVMPYSRLSRPEATAWISQVNPAAIIADECDKLRNPQTATTSRVLRQFANEPTTLFCGWTGSLTDSSIEDYAHLSTLALRYESPLPNKPIVVKDWARALDPGEFVAPAGALLNMCAPGENVRQGFQRRLRETQGVITTTEAAISAPLVISERTAPPIPRVVSDALSELRRSMVRPDGEEFVEALEVAKCARELACGFYYRWIFPKGEPEALIIDWFAKRKRWNKELRDFLRDRKEGLDSPKLATDAAKRYWGDIEGDAPKWKAEHWPAWRDVESLVKPDQEAVRLSDYLAADAAEWGLTNRGIIWYGHVELGQWIAELSGLNRHSGGPKARDKILAETGERSIIASIHSHGRGRNGLQFLFDNQLIASPPSSATAWEQLLGRLHRIGQESGTIRAQYYAHTEEFESAIRQALLRAEYVSGTMGAAQKILAGGLR